MAQVSAVTVPVTVDVRETDEALALIAFIGDGGDPHSIRVIEEFYGVTHG